MAGHAQLKFVMTECPKTQIRLTGLKCPFNGMPGYWVKPLNCDSYCNCIMWHQTEEQIRWIFDNNLGTIFHISPYKHVMGTPVNCLTMQNVILMSTNNVWASAWDYGTCHIGNQQRLRRPKVQHLAPMDGCACAFEEWVYGGWKSTIIS